MDSYKFLKGLLNISMILVIVGWIFLIGLLIYEFQGGSLGESLKLSEDFPANSRNAIITSLVYQIFYYTFIIYLINIAKKLINSLISEKLFTKYQIAGFKLIGQLIIWLVVINALVLFILKNIFQGEATITIGFSKFWIFIALGSFFLLLSKVFENARLLREENELTV